MKALSVRQPFVDHIMSGKKVQEYRTWFTHFRGPLAIHAGSNLNALNAVDRAECVRGVSPIVLGAVVGIVDVVDCIPNPYDEGHWIWILANPRRLPSPVPMKGKLGLFDVDIQDPSPS